MKKASPISRLGSYAHPKGGYTHIPTTNVNFKGPVKAQTVAKPHLATPHKGDKGKHSHPPMRKG